MTPAQAAGHPLVLLPQRAAFLPGHATLLVADLHLGKAAAFRRSGLPVPQGTTAESLDRLSAAVAAVRPSRIVFLGDFLHSARSQGSDALEAARRWRLAHAALDLVLVRGNHDLAAGDPPPGLGLEVVDEPLHLDGLALCHHPRRIPGAYVLAGHLHPALAVGRGVDRARLPCFWLSDGLGVMPAFGAFTGLHAVSPGPGDRVYLVAEDRVVPWG